MDVRSCTDIYCLLQINLIEKLSDRNVRVKVEKRGRLNRIRVTGRTEERFKVVTSIKQLLQEMHKDKMISEQASTLFKTVSTLYPASTSFVICKSEAYSTSCRFSGNLTSPTRETSSTTITL